MAEPEFAPANAGNAPPPGLSTAQQALWWLEAGDLQHGAAWEKAHGLCQQREGQFDCDLVHALAHWIEGDTGNRDYWYRRVGLGWTRAATIAEEWQQISRRVG